MSLSSFVGLFFVIAGAGLQEFSLYRRTVSRNQRKCNDSKATLLLYFSTGLSCEITGLFLISFYSYLVVSNPYPGTFHILFFTYFTYGVPPTPSYKISYVLFIIAFLYFLYRLSLFVNKQDEAPITDDAHVSFILLTILACCASSFLSKYAINNAAKIVMCSGFGSVICICLKQFTVMTVATLEGVYFGLFDILLLLIFLMVCSLAQGSLSSILLEKLEQHRVYAGYYLVNILISFIMGQVLYEEVLEEFSICYISISLVIAGSLVLSHEKYIEKSKFAEV